MDIYSQVFFDHFKFPKNVGVLKKATGKAHEVNNSCGDLIKIELITKEGEIQEIKHQTKGCMVTLATASLLSEELRGKRKSEVLKMGTDEILEIIKVKLTPSRVKCALVPLIAIQKALKNEKN